jgi:hypothetical protein
LDGNLDAAALQNTRRMSVPENGYREISRVFGPSGLCPPEAFVGLRANRQECGEEIRMEKVQTEAFMVSLP